MGKVLPQKQNEMTPENAVHKATQIFDDPTLSDRDKVDDLLWIDAQIYQNLGSASLGSDKEKAKRASACIYRFIKAIDAEKGQRFLNALGYTR